MGCACRPFSPPAAASAPPTTATRFPSRRSDFSASSSLPVFPSVSADGSDRRRLVVSHCNIIRKLDFSFPPLFLRNPKTSAALPPSVPLCPAELGGNNNDDGNNNNGGGGGGGGSWSNSFNSDDWLRGNQSAALIFLVSAVCSVGYFQFASAQARSSNGAEEEDVEVVWEVRGGKWIKLIGDHFRDTFVISTEESSWSSLVDGGVSGKPLHLAVVSNLWMQCRDVFMRLMLPEGYPHSVTSDYMEYCLWRGVQGVAAQISGVLATQSLLYAVGLGKGAIPTAAAVNWVLKDGIGYLSKILLSKFGRHFDVHPKGWRLFADLLENAAFGMEILTPAFPHLFVPIGAVAGAGRSAAALIQAATRSCFYAGFAAQRNFAEVIAKGEAQGMVSKSIGIMLGIALANCVRSSTPLALASFGAITWIHMFCNLKSYQSIQIRTLNPYRASLIFSEYLLSGVVPSIKEVNDEEPLFPALPYLHLRPARNAESTALSAEAKEAAAYIEDRLQLGSKLSDTVRNKDDAVALFDLYKDEGYILTEHEGRYCVALKESCSPQDMLKSVFQVSYLYWLEKHAGIKTHGVSEDCKPGGKMQLSLEYVQMEFNHAKVDGEVTGWVTDGLIARPSPIRIRPGC